MKDYSEVMATMPTQIKQLNDLLHEKKWEEANEFADKIRYDMQNLCIWLNMNKIKRKTA